MRLFFFCLPGLLLASDLNNDNTYRTENRLFHIERSKNRNIVCYDLNMDATGKPDEKQPLSVYWINREEHPGKQEGLSYIQQQLAYGYTVAEKRNGAIVIGINAAKDRLITVEHDERSYFCRIEINRRPAVLTKIYIKTKTPNSLQVEYVEIEGLDMMTGAPVKERIIP
jgi:hypothetical protein